MKTISFNMSSKSWSEFIWTHRTIGGVEYLPPKERLEEDGKAFEDERKIPRTQWKFNQDDEQDTQTELLNLEGNLDPIESSGCFWKIKSK